MSEPYIVERISVEIRVSQSIARPVVYFIFGFKRTEKSHLKRRLSPTRINIVNTGHSVVVCHFCGHSDTAELGKVVRAASRLTRAVGTVTICIPMPVAVAVMLPKLASISILHSS